MKINYKKISLNLVGVCIGLLIVFGIVFSLLSDHSKAKITLNLLGIHERNLEDFTIVKEVVLNNRFELYETKKEVPQELIRLIDDVNGVLLTKYMQPKMKGGTQLT